MRHVRRTGEKKGLERAPGESTLRRHTTLTPRAGKGFQLQAARSLRAARCVRFVLEVVVVLAVIAGAIVLVMSTEVVVEEVELIERPHVDVVSRCGGAAPAVEGCAKRAAPLPVPRLVRVEVGEGVLQQGTELARSRDYQTRVGELWRVVSRGTRVCVSPVLVR